MLRNKLSSNALIALIIIAVGSVGIFLIYMPVIAEAHRGEAWELLNIINNNNSFYEKLYQISSFVCFGAGRFQPLAFFAPYLIGNAFEGSLVAPHIFSEILHICCGLLTSYIYYTYSKKSINSAFLFIVCIYSFLTSDVVTWSFFSYIQIQTLLILGATYFTYQYYEKNQIKLIVLSWVLAFIACFIYESAVSFFIAQIAFGALFSGKISLKVFFLRVVCPSVILVIYLAIGILVNGTNYADSNTQFHLLIFIKPLYYFLYYLRYSIGFETPVVVYNIASIWKLNLNFDIRTFILLAIVGIFLGWYIKNLYSKKEIDINKSFNKKTIFLVLLGYFYVLIIAFGRVPSGVSFLQATGLETQFRYYYAFCFLFPAIVFFGLEKYRFHKNFNCYFLAMIAIISICNLLNICNFVKEISLASAPTTKHANRLLTEISNNSSKVEIQKEFIRRMHQDWYTESIDTSRAYYPFTFNANTCKNYPNYARKSDEKKFEIKIQQSSLNKSGSQKPISSLSLISPDSIKIEANSFIYGSTPYDALYGRGLWHVEHIPQPPLDSWLLFDMGVDGRVLSGISFKVRAGHPQHFWSHMILLGSNNKLEWNEIVDVQLTSRPPEGWIEVPLINQEKNRYYLVKLNGGFSSGRFISLEGIKLYEQK